MRRACIHHERLSLKVRDLLLSHRALPPTTTAMSTPGGRSHTARQRTRLILGVHTRLVRGGRTRQSAAGQGLGRRSAALLGPDTRRRTRYGYGWTARGDVWGMAAPQTVSQGCPLVPLGVRCRPELYVRSCSMPEIWPEACHRHDKRMVLGDGISPRARSSGAPEGRWRTRPLSMP